MLLPSKASHPLSVFHPIGSKMHVRAYALPSHILGNEKDSGDYIPDSQTIPRISFERYILPNERSQTFGDYTIGIWYCREPSLARCTR